MLEITLDSGATVSYIKLSKAVSLGLTILPNHQLALLADEKTRMASIGEVDFQVFLNSICMRVRALVMKNLQVECFGGTTFHVDNDIQARIKMALYLFMVSLQLSSRIHSTHWKLIHLRTIQTKLSML